ncbi:hypothetical protein GCM10009609_51670 [Pseudonocardia aurantiaca]|uniref:LysM domain-containing protein n=1 Tax=Pseudonocardia aurantiaca TaxID=75290 RepID=A0ABW4FST0_9PSEU
MHEHEVSGRPIEGRRGAGAAGGFSGRGVPVRVPPRRRARGPRPVRPGVVAVAVRPAEAERPQLVRRARRAEPLRSGPRVLVRRPVAEPISGRGVRVVAGLAAMAATAAVVMGLGLLAGAASEGRGGSGAPARPVATVTVEAESTVWEVAERVAPASSGPELAAVAERIVTDNSLTTVRLRPGQVLRVTGG